MTTFSVEIRITPREGILDPEGQTIARALGNLGYEGVSDVRAGRLVRMRVESPDADAARERVVRMCEELIANPVIEDYAVRLAPAGGGPEAGGAETAAVGKAATGDGTPATGDGTPDAAAGTGTGSGGGAP